MGRRSMEGRQAGRHKYSDAQWQVAADGLNLTRRELEVIQALFDDHNVAAIAQTLGISASTVYSHLANIYSKLSVTNRVALTIRVIEELLDAQNDT